MTTVLIAKQNKDIFLSINPRLKIKDVTTNTAIFRTTKFKEIYNGVKALGYNPFALMSW